MSMWEKNKSFAAISTALFLSAALLTACGSSNTVTGAESQKSGGTVADIASYEGADREQRLIAAAKQEGGFNLYTVLASEDLQPLVSGFESKYGIKVNVWRAGSEKILQKVVSEAQANHTDFDVVQVNAPELEAIYHEKLLQEVKSPNFKDLIPGAVPSHKGWAPYELFTFVQAYNTNAVKKEELPRTYEDLLDPKWKGRLGIESTDHAWFGTVVNDMGAEKGLEFWKQLVGKNGVSVRTGHSLLTNLVASGEVPLGLTVYSYKADLVKKKGAPFDWFVIEPAISMPSGVGVSSKSKHPNAAVLFFDYVIGDGQKIMADTGHVPASQKYKTPLNDIKMKFIDPQIYLDENDKWLKSYTTTVVEKGSK